MPLKIIDNTIHSVKGILYRIKNNEPLFLITHEADTDLFGFPGGALDEEDADTVTTLKREIYEELGITDKSYKIIDPDIVHKFIHEDPKSPRYLKKGILHVYLLEYNNVEEIHPSPELIEVSWLKEKEAVEKLKSSYSYWLPLLAQITSYLKQAHSLYPSD